MCFRKTSILAVFLAMAASLSADETDIKFGDIDYASTPDQARYPDSDALILLKEGKITFDKDGYIYTVHKMVKIFSERGYEWANVSIPFIKGYSDIVEIKSRIMTPNGEIFRLDDSQYFEVTDFPDYIMYADHKAKRFTMPKVQTGAIIEYIFTQRLQSIAIPTWTFQETEPIVFSRFILEVPLIIKYRILKKTGEEDIKIDEDVRNQGNKTIAIYTVKDVPPLLREPFMPPEDNVIPQLKFAPVALAWFWMAMPLQGRAHV